MKIHPDFETRSELDLDKVGVWTYAAHPSTDIICMGVGFSSGAPFAAGVHTLTAREAKTPDQLASYCSSSDFFISAHNAHFEFAIWHHILHKRYGWPAMDDPSRWYCTMARALACGLPASLDELGRVLLIKTPKDLEGRRLMLQMCKPKGYTFLGEPIWDEDPKRLARLYAYNATDVKAEMEVDGLLPQLSEGERKVWEQDLLMNRRGIKIDLEFARAAAPLSRLVLDDISARLKKLTGGKIKAITQVTAIKDYLKSRGVKLPTKYRDGESVESIDKVALVRMLMNPEVDAHCREVIYLRQQGGKSTSTAKYQQVLETVGDDGRVRGTVQYHAAHTGRWGGRLLQPHNIPQGFKGEEGEEKQLRAVDLAKNNDPALFMLEYGDKAMDALSDSLRGLIVAGEGNELLVADYAAIEARGVFWFADDTEALACYARGESPYIQMANYVYKRDDITKTKDPLEYDIGKRVILGCGFGMSWLKFRDSVFEETAKRGKPVWLEDEVAKRAVKGYRELHKPVVDLWYATSKAAIDAVKNPGQRYEVAGGKILYSMSADRRFLVCRLPSGRYLWYWKPSVKPVITYWCPAGHGKLDREDESCYCPECDKDYPALDIKQTKLELHYWGKHPRTKAWCELKTYGGAEVENYVQATARDLMANGMLKAEADGFPLVLTVHDEELAEAKKGTKTLERFIEVLCDKPAWAAGYPVAAEGWVATRYRK